ncbi:hypothetical protein ABES02_29350 [Neobacillus pocheonensis]
MFNRTLGELLGIAGQILAIGIIIFGGLWLLLKGMNVQVSDIFNNINMPS